MKLHNYLWPCMPRGLMWVAIIKHSIIIISYSTLSLDDSPQTIPAAPVISNVTNTSAFLSWMTAPGIVEAYRIELIRSLDDSVSIATYVSTFTSFFLFGLEPDSTYSVRIFTMNQNGFSDPSATASFTTQRKWLLWPMKHG